MGTAGAARLRGPVLGGEGRLVFNGFAVGLGLSSGTLQTADQAVKRDLIEAGWSSPRGRCPGSK